MKVYMGPPKRWFGPYQLAELLCWWAKNDIDEFGGVNKPEWVHRFGEWLAHGTLLPEPKLGDESTALRDERPKTWLYRFLLWVDSKRSRKIWVRIDNYDTWSVDRTLAYIALPLLLKLKERKQGAPAVDDEDVPVELRSTGVPENSNELDTDHNYFERWNWVLDEMIFAFKSELDDNAEDQFYSGTADLRMVVDQVDATGKPVTYHLVKGPNHTWKIDEEGQKRYYDRVQRGFCLFGKYYRNLWS
jgi:hypothetical protein